MTNKNKNSRSLVANADNESPPDFDGLSAQNNYFASEIEVDAITFDIDELRPKVRSRADLHNALIEQTKLTEELKFEIEHLCNKQRGLNEELKARAEIAANLNSEIRESRSQLSEAKRTIESRKEEFKTNLALLEKSNALTERLQDRTRGLEIARKDLKRKLKLFEKKLSATEKNNASLEVTLRNRQRSVGNPSLRSKNKDKEIVQLESQLRKTRVDLSDLRNYVNGRRNAWAKLNADLEDVRARLDKKNGETIQLSREIDERNSQLVRSREQYISASKQLALLKSKVRKLSKKSKELQLSLDHDAKNEIAACRIRITEQSGELAAQGHELDGLRKDISRIERYSDSLRIQLQDQISNSKISAASRKKLESGLDAANETIIKLSDELKKERQQNEFKANAIEKMHDEFEREVRQIRFELAAAEDTVAGQTTINGQLASDLIDNKDYSQSLETQFSEFKNESYVRTRDLTTQLNRAKQEADKYARELEHKASVIADLMHELSNHTSNKELKSEFDTVLQKIDGYKPDKDDKPNRNFRERVARLLIGNADGRELRFPLFKDRLTIGRTSHNDIQLNKQYVSRRHAVISTDHGRTRVIDWGSKNGVFVNNTQVTERILESGDTVTIGTADFKYEERPKR